MYTDIEVPLILRKFGNVLLNSNYSRAILQLYQFNGSIMKSLGYFKGTLEIET